MVMIPYIYLKLWVYSVGLLQSLEIHTGNSILQVREERAEITC